MKKQPLRQFVVISLLALFGLSSQVFAQYQNQINAMTWYLQGVRYHSQGDFDRAIYAFDQAIWLMPNYADAWFKKGLALGSAHRYQEAIASIDQAIRLQPNNGMAWLGKAVVLNEAGRKQEALQCVERAFRVFPDLANNPEVAEFLRGAGLSVGPSKQGNSGGAYNPNLRRSISGGNHAGEPHCTERECFQCGGRGEIGPFGNPYSGAGYRPAERCSNCGGTGRVKRCY